MLLALALASLGDVDAEARVPVAAAASPDAVLQSLNTEFDHWAYPQVSSAMVHALRCDRARVAVALETRLKAAFRRVSSETTFLEARLKEELARRGAPQVLKQPCSSATMERRLASANRTLERIEDLLAQWESLQQ